MEEYTNTSENMEEPKNHEIKKFVFRIYDENIDLIETMSSDEKNDFINNLIDSYRDSDDKAAKKEKLINLCKKTAIGIILTVIGLPLFILLVNFSFDLTLNSYSKMQKNFEKLFD